METNTCIDYPEVRLVVKHTFFGLEPDDPEECSPARRRTCSDSDICCSPSKGVCSSFPPIDNPTVALEYDEMGKDLDTASTITPEPDEDVCSDAVPSEGEVSAAAFSSPLARLRAQGRMLREAIEGSPQAGSLPNAPGCGFPTTTAVPELGTVDSLQDKSSRRRSRKKKTATADAEPSVEMESHADAYGACFSNGSVSEVDGRTTLMLRNIPNSYGRDALVALLEAQGLSGCYNFVYLPIDFARQSSLGFAFVNMVGTACAETAMQRLQGFHNWSSMSPKVLQVTWSHPVQGLTAHLERYRNSPVMHGDIQDAFKPAYFVDGRRAPFPEASRRVRLPRARPSRT